MAYWARCQTWASSRRSVRVEARGASPSTAAAPTGDFGWQRGAVRRTLTFFGTWAAKIMPKPYLRPELPTRSCFLYMQTDWSRPLRGPHPRPARAAVLCAAANLSANIGRCARDKSSRRRCNTLVGCRNTTLLDHAAFAFGSRVAAGARPPRIVESGSLGESLHGAPLTQLEIRLISLRH